MAEPAGAVPPRRVRHQPACPTAVPACPPTHRDLVICVSTSVIVMKSTPLEMMPLSASTNRICRQAGRAGRGRQGRQ